MIQRPRGTRDFLPAEMAKGRRGMALRPEITASVIMFYVSDMSSAPKPLKLYYVGNCFRYENPQSGRYREFWQLGAELIGTKTPETDAEVIALAVNCIRNAGLENFVVRVGHIGILKSLVQKEIKDPKPAADVPRVVRT